MVGIVKTGLRARKPRGKIIQLLVVGAFLVMLVVGASIFGNNVDDDDDDYNTVSEGRDHHRLGQRRDVAYGDEIAGIGGYDADAITHTFGKDPMQDDDYSPDRGYAEFGILHHAKKRHHEKVPTWNEQRAHAFGNELIYHNTYGHHDDGERTARGVGFRNRYAREAPESTPWFSSWFKVLFAARTLPEGQDRKDNLYGRG